MTVTPDDSSAAQEIAWAGPRADIVKELNTLFATVLAAGQGEERPLDGALGWPAALGDTGPPTISPGPPWGGRKTQLLVDADWSVR